MRSAAGRANIPARSLQNVLDGKIPSVKRAEEICQALGLEFYIGPPRPDDAKLDVQVSIAGNTFESALLAALVALASGPPSSHPEPVESSFLALMLSVFAVEYKYLHSHGRQALASSFWDAFPDLEDSAPELERTVVQIVWRELEDGDRHKTKGGDRKEGIRAESVIDHNLALILSALSDEFGRLNRRGRSSFVTRFWTAFSGLKAKAFRLTPSVVALAWTSRVETTGFGPMRTRELAWRKETGKELREATAIEPVIDTQFQRAISIMADEYARLNDRGRIALMNRFWHSFPDLRKQAWSLNGSVVSLGWHDPDGEERRDVLRE